MDLVYDVGVENGDDSAYYLHKGFRVVGIEASPLAVDRLRTRFAAEIRDQLYVLLPVGVAAAAGEKLFWVCDDHPPWSSFDRAIASRRGARHHSVTVATRTFASVLEEFGRAVFCKIDIEGNDNLCLAALTRETRPEYLSIEMIDGAQQLNRLRELGYRGFKIISQRSFQQPMPALLRLKSLLPRTARLPISKVESLFRHTPDPDWRFLPGSSGPFGETTAGRWRTFDEAMQDCRAVARLGPDLSDWHDLHARIVPPIAT